MNWSQWTNVTAPNSVHQRAHSTLNGSLCRIQRYQMHPADSTAALCVRACRHASVQRQLDLSARPVSHKDCWTLELGIQQLYWLLFLAIFFWGGRKAFALSRPINKMTECMIAFPGCCVAPPNDIISLVNKIPYMRIKIIKCISFLCYAVQFFLHWEMFYSHVYVSFNESAVIIFHCWSEWCNMYTV